MSAGGDFAASVKRGALARLRALVQNWLPNGRFEGDEYLALNPRRTDLALGSFKINVRTGKWADFATHDRGGDVIGLYAFVHAMERRAALLALADSLGIAAPAARAPRVGRAEEGAPLLHRRTTNAQALGLTLSQYAEAKRLPLDFLAGLGVTQISYLNRPAVRIPYFDARGSLAATRFRTALGGEGLARFRWKKGDKQLLYGLWRLDQSQAEVVIVEGESDAHTLWRHDINALGLPGASSWSEARDAPALSEFSVINVVIEADQGGESMLAWLAQSAIRQRVRLVRLGEDKDPSALYLRAPENFKALWAEVVAGAEEWSVHAVRRTAGKRQAAEAASASLARAPDILARLVEDARAAGLVGEDRAVKLVYLAATSRVLAKPVSIVVKGPSSGGKSFVVQIALSFLPDDAYYALTAMSERALAYDETPLRHRMLVIYEEAGVQGEIASYLLRSLLSEHRVRYVTVEQVGGRMQPREVVREGPTGLIVTTTKIALHPENETRLLSVPIEDSPEQTARVLREMAREDRAAPDNSDWHALQTWISLQSSEVTVPFGDALAGLVPPAAVRLRRDFGKVLSLIRAHALLHQACRDRDARGRIVAMLRDYEAVRELVADLVAEAAERSVKESVRETVGAVARILARAKTTPGELAGASNSAVAAELGLDTSAASRRLHEAMRLGFLVDKGLGPGHPRAYVLGAPMHRDTSVLPPLEDLAAACERAERLHD